MARPETLEDLLPQLREGGDAPAIFARTGDRLEPIAFAQLCAAAERIEGGAIGLMALNGAAWVEALWA
jgi:hypothetical protein